MALRHRFPLVPFGIVALLLCCGFGRGGGAAPISGFDPIIRMDNSYWPVQDANITITLDPKVVRVQEGRSYSVVLTLPAGWSNNPGPFTVVGGSSKTVKVRTGTALGSFVVIAVVNDGPGKVAEGRFATTVSQMPGAGIP